MIGFTKTLVNYLLPNQSCDSWFIVHFKLDKTIVIIASVALASKPLDSRVPCSNSLFSTANHEK
jgi:hypothetical protein